MDVVNWFIEVVLTETVDSKIVVGVVSLDFIIVLALTVVDSSGSSVSLPSLVVAVSFNTDSVLINWQKTDNNNMMNTI